MVIAVVTAGLAIAAMTPGLRLWPDLVTGLSSATVYTGALAAGVSALEAARWSSFGRARSRFTSRPLLVVRFVHAGSVALPLISGYALGLAFLVIYGAAIRAYGTAYPLWLTAVGAALLTAIGFGYLIGYLAGNYWFVPPAAALGYYAIFVVTRSLKLPFGVTSLFPYITNTDSVFVSYVNQTMIGQIILWACLAALLVLFAQRGIRRLGTPFGTTALVGLAIFSLVGGALVVQADGQYTVGHNPGNFVCKTGALTMCLNPGYAQALPELYQQFRSLNKRAAGTTLVAHRLEQNVEGVGDDPSAGARSVYLEEFAGREDLAFAAYRYVTKYGATPACIRRGIQTESQSTTEAIEDVDAWLSGYSYAASGFADSRQFDSLRAMTNVAANRWFRAHQRDYFACTLTLADFP